MDGQKSSTDISPKKVCENMSIITCVPSENFRLKQDIDTLDVHVLNDLMQTPIEPIPRENVEQECSFIVHVSKNMTKSFCKII